MNKVLEYLKKQGAIVNTEYREHIERWHEWYRGKVKGFHEYNIFNGIKSIKHQRLTLCMPKKAAEDWANLLLNERVIISTDSEKFNKVLDETFERNKFLSRGNQLIEKAFALGTGAFVEWLDIEKKVVIDYVEANMIFPITIENGEIIECAFASERTVEGAKQFYIQTHYRNRITNVLLDDKGKPIALPVNMSAKYPTKQKCFQIVKPNVVNNLHLHQPLGMSIFANALDQARACDTVFDSMVNDFAVGRSRIMVPMKYAQVAQMADGTKRPVFDTADTVFTVFESANEGAKIEFVQPEIRAEQHKAGIQTALALFADKCGLGNDRYKFEKGSVQTATQVISEKSELYQNVQKHELLLNDALLEMVEAIAYHTGATYKEATVTFDDSIIEDKAAKKAAFISEINAGIRQPWEYRVEFLGEDEATAQAAIQAPVTSDAGGFGDTGAGA